MMEYVEISAKDEAYLVQLDSLFSRLAQKMLQVRQSMEMTNSMVARADKTDVIVLDEWEVISAPEVPIPKQTYKAHEAARSRTNKKCSC